MVTLPSCELAPGCPQNTSHLYGCSNHGTCNQNTGACSCSQMNRTFQVGTRLGSGSKGRIARNASEQDGTDPENADPAECRFWRGADCSIGSILSPTLAEQLIQVNESGALYLVRQEHLRPCFYNSRADLHLLFVQCGRSK